MNWIAIIFYKGVEKCGRCRTLKEFTFVQVNKPKSIDSMSRREKAGLDKSS